MKAFSSFAAVCRTAILPTTAALLMAVCIASAARAEKWAPVVGETIVYDMKLARITLARQTMTVEEKTRVGEDTCIMVSSASKSVGIAKSFASMDNRNETCLDPATLAPIQFKSRIREKDWKADTKISFDKGKIVIDEIRGEKLDEKRHTELKSSAGVLDEVSIIFALRGRDFKIGDTFNVKILADREIQDAKITVLRREKLKTKIGERDVLVVKSTFSDALFWIEVGPDRIPLRFEVKTKAGRITGMIKEYKSGK